MKGAEPSGQTMQLRGFREKMSDLDKFNYECEGQMSLFDDEKPMDSITTEMAEHICDNLCRFPREMDEEELVEHCCECKIGQFICDILNEYNKLNNFEQTQCCKLLQKIAELERGKVQDGKHI